MKTKDYLGKARLVAASDRQNAFTGFAGSEIKKMANAAKDDRPEDKLSYAATNLVKPELQSRVRQQSEPPMTRNMFPPTPPPESDNRRSAGEKGGQMSRAQSVRGGGPKPQPLNLGRAAFDQKDDRRDDAPPQRRGTQRSASERPPNRSNTMRMRDMDRRDRDRPRRRGSDDDVDDYADDVYDMYQPRSNRPSYSRSRQGKTSRPAYIDEEEEDDFDGSDVDDGEFEMVSRSKTRRRSPTRSATSSRSGGNVGGKIRVKVHAGDTRYVFITPNTSMREFVQSIREKFGVRQNFKVEIKDDGDMITMADEDDLDMAIQTARQMARKEGGDVAKMEVWLTFVPSSAQNKYPPSNPPLTPSIEISEY